MTHKTWDGVDFVTFLGLDKTLTPLEIEDLTNSLNREVLYRTVKDHRDPLAAANDVKKEFILAYLKDIPEMTKTVIEQLESDEPDFDYCSKLLASFWASGRRTLPA
jgi:hypothetical protein